MSELPGGQLGACFSLNLQHRMRLRKCWDDEAAGDVEKSSDKQEGRPGLGGPPLDGEDADEGAQLWVSKRPC